MFVVLWVVVELLEPLDALGDAQGRILEVVAGVEFEFGGDAA